ncbi:threonine/homoserine/homoserine lactone efflux protein [Roseiarcus fermentans]|uniref:Threonine/homoserine/homoserine lactone efflux protein n=1 Tax=Roseiarcus fermentans TaxID=1473586 RepID=A0A366FSM2_9HYPH|nr:LysE family transporter [Roseiarcus fermentans]RBP17567.1 threonine/homoserine/homoserine lactone efflux protein [Roseiarcus fermentans]
MTSLPALIGAGFLLGWSVAWPPGPINAEIARRCGAGRFWSGLAVLAGASSADALWAVAVALGVGLLFTAPLARAAMGVVSIALLIALAGLFLRGAWRAWAGRGGEPEAKPAPSRFGSVHGGFGLGAAMALTSPWNVAFWLAAMGRPELAGAKAAALLIMAAAVIAGALTWGVIWATANTLLHRGLDGDARRAWTIFVDLATGLLMLVFAATSAQRLLG